MEGGAKWPTALKPVCEYRPPEGTCCFCQSRAPAFWGQNTGPLSSEDSPEAECKSRADFYWTKSGNYLITSNYAACGTTLAPGGWHTPSWAPQTSGNPWYPNSYLKCLRNSCFDHGQAGALTEGLSTHLLLPENPLSRSESSRLEIACCLFVCLFSSLGVLLCWFLGCLLVFALFCF